MSEDPDAPIRWLPPQTPERPDPDRAPGPPAFVRPSVGSATQGTEPLAVTSLVMALAGLVVLTLSLGIGFLFSLACSSTAWLTGVRAKRRLAQDGARGGEGIAQAGIALGLVGVALGVVAMVVWTVLVLDGLSLSEFQEDLRRELERRRSGAR